jgi:RNA polymerase sigma-70 factor (ECF subfamily)
VNDDAQVRVEALLAHRAWLHALSRRLVGPGLADDLVQETWLAALRRPPDPARGSRPWLATVARRLARRLRARAEEPGAPDPPDPRPSTDELLARVELESELAREVARLAEPFRRTVLLRYHAGLSAAEIARREGVPAGTVRWRLKRGLDLLRARLDARFGDRRAWGSALAPLAALAGAPAGGVAAASWGKVALVATLAVVAAGGGAWRLARPGGGSSLASEGGAEPELVAMPRVDESGGAKAALAAGGAPGERMPAGVAPPPAVAAAPTGLWLRFVEWDGAPSAGRLTAMRAGDGEVSSATTDGDGAVAFAGGETRGIVAIAHDRAGAAPYVFELDARAPNEVATIASGERGVPGERVIEMPRGAEVSGRLLVDGEPPRAPLELVLFASKGPDQLPLFPPEARAALLLGGRVPVAATTDAEGRFRFVGLDAGWRGCIAFPRGYVPPDRVGRGDPWDRHSQFVERPIQDLEIELAMRPHVSARIVESDGVTPVDLARVEAYLRFADGTGSIYGATTDAAGGGWFAVFPDEWPLRRVALSICGADGRGAREVVFEGDRLPADGELGDVALAPGRAVLVRVTDATDGAPVEGARVRGSDARSGARGELALEVELEATELRVGAPGFASGDVAVPAGATEVALALEPTTTLVVIAVGPDGAPLAGLVVELAADGPFFDGEPGSMPDTLTSFELAGRWHTTRTSDTGMVGQLGTDEAGRFVGQGFRAGTAFTLNARTVDGLPLAEAVVAPLEPRERREVELRAARVPHALAVRVADESGAPVSRAEIYLTPVGRDAGEREIRSHWLTDALGRKTIANLSEGALRLEVREADHLPFALEPVLAPADGEVLDVVLRRGLRFAVRVVDAEGRAVDGGRLAHRAEEIGAGRFEVRGARDEPLELRLHVGGRVFRKAHDPRAGEARIVVPTPGAARVAWTTPPGVDWGEWRRVVLVAVDPAPDPDAHELSRLFADTPDGEAAFETLFPGAYRAELRHYEDEDRLVVFARSAEFTVRAGETARVTLRPVSD